MNNSMNNTKPSSSPTQPTAMLSSSNNSTPPPPSSAQQPTVNDHVIQSMREGNDNAPTFNTSNNATDDNNPVSLQREGGVDNNNATDNLEGGNPADTGLIKNWIRAFCSPVPKSRLPRDFGELVVCPGFGDGSDVGENGENVWDADKAANAVRKTAETSDIYTFRL